MKDLIYDIDMKECDKVIQMACDEGYEFYELIGSLQDNYLIVGNKSIRVGRAKPREYIIIREHYLNSWSSELIMTMTNNEKLADEFYNEWEIQQDEMEKEYEEMHSHN